MADMGKVNIHGREYKTVALRVSEFRTDRPDWSITTEIVEADAERVVMRATITHPDGRIIATGHAEEVRASSQINRTSALENAETSAIGRALAAAGYGGSEFASADEVAQAIAQQAASSGAPQFGKRQAAAPKPKPAPAPAKPAAAPEVPADDPWLEEPLGFGKHADKTWRTMSEGELGSGRANYLQWLLDNAMDEVTSERARRCLILISNRADKAVA